MIRTAMLAVLIGSAAALPAQEAVGVAMGSPSVSASAREAAATVDAFHVALRRGDTRSAAALLAGDALIFEGGGVERSKAEYAAHHLPADAAFAQAVQSTVTRRAGHSNGAIAWIASEGRTAGTFRGRALDQLTTETMVLRRVGRGWKIIHIHWSSAARK